jgi:uncharacterized protein HemY
LHYAKANYRNHKGNPDALSTLGWVYFRLDRFDAAGLALDQATKADDGKPNNPDTATYLAHVLHHDHEDWEASVILEDILQRNKRSFSMKPEAQKLYEKVKDAKKPEGPAEQ